MAKYPPAPPVTAESDPVASAAVAAEAAARAGADVDETSARVAAVVAEAAARQRDQARASGPFEGSLPVSTRHRHIDANKTPTTILSNGVDTVNTSLVKVPIKGGGYGLRARFDNFIVSNNGNTLAGEQDGTQAITVSATAVLPDGSVVALKYRGALSWVIDPGGGMLTDLAGCYVYDGDVVNLYVRVQVAAAATKFQLGLFTNAANGEGVDHAAATTLAGGNVPAITASSEYAYTAQALTVARPFTTTVPRWVLGLGDSITGGFGDLDVDLGYVARGLAGHLPFVNLSRGGDRARWLAQAPQGQRFRRWRYVLEATDIYFANGINDLSAGSFNTVADLTGFWQTVIANIRAVNPDARIWVPTVTPSPTSTDKFITVANQSPGAPEATRPGANDWLRANLDELVGGLGGIIELADFVETAHDSGIYKVPGNVGVGDISTAAGGKTITNVVGDFPVGTILNGTGLAQNTIVTNVAGATLTIDKPVTQTIAGRAIGTSYLLDGIHLNGNGCPWAAAVLQPVIDAA